MTPGMAVSLSAEAMIDIWEQGTGRHPIDQALLLLCRVCPEQSLDALCDWTVGERDMRLLEIRRATFGDRINGYAECPACCAGLDFELSCEALLASAVPNNATWRTIEQAGCAWDVRGPNSRDLALAAAAPDLEQARRVILSRCVREGTGTSQSGHWMEELGGTLAARLSELDPLAEILIDVQCESCAHRWQTVFDIATFFWNEIHARSRRLLQEVDLLARTYGWTEGEILRMKDQRRSLYVEMALS